MRIAALASLSLISTAVGAHSFGRLYNLPVPFWMYAYAATAALLLSFLLIGFFVNTAHDATPSEARDIRDSRLVRALRRARLLPVLKTLSVLMLLLCIATGFFGNPNPYQNFSMTFFWIVFVLGFAYLTAVTGDLYAAISPWQVLAETLDRVFRNFTKGRWTYPERWGYAPALLLYMAFIWIELFGHTRPFSVAVMLSGYSALTLFGVWAYGAAAWFRYGEFFAVFLRLTARMAPFDYTPGRLRWRWPFAGLLQSQATHTSLLLFVLFMLSSTAFDGLRATVPWVRFFWDDPFGLLSSWLGKSPILAFTELRPYYRVYESLWLWLSPFLYYGIYSVFIELSRRLGGSRLSRHELALRFAFSLLPIALVYNITHYYTLILTQGVKILSLLSDPFGWGWNLFGTAGLLRTPFLPDMAWVWHTQVGLIVFGHIVSVYIAHREALRAFDTPRQAALSQLPMLVLMMLFTSFGLWILAQPIQSGT